MVHILRNYYILMSAVILICGILPQEGYANEQTKTTVSITIESGRQNPTKKTDNSDSFLKDDIDSKKKNSAKLPQTGDLLITIYPILGTLVVIITIRSIRKYFFNEKIIGGKLL